VKYKLGAAVAVVSLMCAPAIVVAGASSWAVVTGTTYNHGDQVVNGLDHSWTPVELLHDAVTDHALIDTTPYVPPDPCKHIAEKWNRTVAHNPTHLNKFEHLFVKMARHNCKITFVPGTTNSDGTVNLNEVAPKP